MVGSHTPTYVPSHPPRCTPIFLSVIQHIQYDETPWFLYIELDFCSELIHAKPEDLEKETMTLRLRALAIPPNNCPLEHTLNIPCSTLRNVPPKWVDSRPGQPPSLKGDGCFNNSRDGICGLMFEKIQGLSPNHSCAKLARILLIFLYCCSGRPLGKLLPEEWCPGSLLRSKGQPYTVTSRPGSS